MGDKQKHDEKTLLVTRQLSAKSPIYPASKAQKLKTLPAKEQRGCKIKVRYIIVRFVLLSQSWCKNMKIAFLREGTDIKWESRTGAGTSNSKAQGKVKGKGTTAGKTSKQETEAHWEVMRLQHAAIHTLSLFLRLSGGPLTYKHNKVSHSTQYDSTRARPVRVFRRQHWHNFVYTDAANASYGVSMIKSL